MSKKTGKAVVKYKPLFADSNSAFKTERSLDTMIFSGSYLVEITHNGVDVGLPIDDCGEEHYINGTLIVCDCGTKGPRQRDRIIGQNLMYVNKKNRQIMAFMRTLDTGMWSEWRHLLISGELSGIETSDELIAALNVIENDNRTLMGDGEGSVKRTIEQSMSRSAISFCADENVNAYIRELYISGEDVASKGFYVERIIKNVDNTCAIYIYSADKSVMLYIQTKGKVPYGYIKCNSSGYTLETIINFEKVAEKWGDHVLDAITGKLLESSYNLDLSPVIKAIHLRADSIMDIRGVVNGLSVLEGAVTASEVVAIKGKYLMFDGTVSSDYTKGYYSDYYPVVSNNRVRYNGKVQFGVAAWAFYDVDKNFISAYPNGFQNDMLVLDDVLVENIPETARFIRFGGFSEAFDAEIRPAELVSLAEFEEHKAEFEDYRTYNVAPNVLYSKSVLWVGDSIMEGSVRMTPSFGGFAKIIADRNSMQSTNYGIGGTCITKLPGKTNSIVERVENYSKNVDYIILQGGLNDIVHAAEVFGEISTAYNTDFDKETFCGACEWLCKYVIENYSTKKYGFIITYNIGSNDWRDRWAEAIVSVCKKWGMPFLDLRSEAGFNLASTDLRELYGTYIGNVAEYDLTKGYALDEQVKYNGALYKANVDIPSPAGEFDDSKWTLQESGNASDYDSWHCNVLAYQKLADKVEAWMRSL